MEIFENSKDKVSEAKVSAGTVLTAEKFCSMVDHSFLRAFATEKDLERLCAQALEYGFKSVAINPVWVPYCVEKLKGSAVLTGAAIGFPLGQNSPETKVFEAARAIEDGAGEFDYVMNIGRAVQHDWTYIEQEMRSMVSVGKKHGVCVKVILETCYLTDDEIMKVSEIASEVKPDFVKTSTGFGTAGAKPEHIRLMKRCAGPDVQVKAAGGIRTLADVLAVTEAGASRIGCSTAVQILSEIRGAGK